MTFRRVLTTFRSIAKIMTQPRYALVALVSSFVAFGILVWLFAFDTLLYVLGLPNYPASEKLSYFFSPYVNSLTYFFRDPVVASRLIFVLLLGVNVALYTYIRRHQQAVVARKGLGGFFVALIASGCIACGTSILSPLLVGVGAGASALIGATVSTIGYLLGIILMAYSIYGFSMRANYELIKLQ